MNGDATADGGWFRTGPAHRLATFRVVVAVTTLLFHVPNIDRLVQLYLRSSFHVPIWESLPALPSGWISTVFILSYHVAAWCLLLGIASRLSAGWLAITGCYVVMLESASFAHNTWLHLNLLFLLSLVSDRLSLPRLLSTRGDDARCALWPESLIRFQIFAVMFYAAFDKLFSPFWGLSGRMMVEFPQTRNLVTYAYPIEWVQALSIWMFVTFPSVLSVATIVAEFGLAVVVFLRSTWRFAVPFGVVFLIYLEFLVRPGTFAWDVVAVLLVMMPTDARPWSAPFDASCRRCSRNRNIVTRLDWLRRIRWTPIETARAPAPGFSIVSPSGSALPGFHAMRQMLLLMIGPVYVFLALVRFGVFGERFVVLFGASDILFLLLFGIAALWLPGVTPWIDKHIYPRGIHGLRGFLLGDADSEDSSSCALHGRRDKV